MPEKFCFFIYLAVVGLGHLLIQTVPHHAPMLQVLGVCTASLVLIRYSLLGKGGPCRFKYLQTSLNPLLVSFLLFLVLQVLPLPELPVRFLSPGAHTAEEYAVPARYAVAACSHSAPWWTLAPYLYPVETALMNWISYGLFFIGLVMTLNTQERIEIAIGTILLLTLMASLCRCAGQGSTARGDLSVLMEMGLLLATTYVTAVIDAGKATDAFSARKCPAGKTTLWRFATGPEFIKWILALSTVALTCLGLLLSCSQGALLASACGLLLIALLLFTRDRRQRVKSFAVLALSILMLSWAFYGGAGGTNRASSFLPADTVSGKEHKKEQTDSFSIAGVGLGGSRSARSSIQKPGSGEGKLEEKGGAAGELTLFGTEVGYAGIFILLAGLLYHVYQTWAVWRYRMDPFAICMGLLPPAVLTSIVVHLCIDPTLHLQANGFTLAAILAIGYSALRLERKYGTRALYEYRILPLKYRGILLLSVAMALITWSSIEAARRLAAQRVYDRALRDSLQAGPEKSVEGIQAALAFDGGNAAFWYELGMELRSLRNKQTMNLVEGGSPESHLLEPIVALEKAVRLNPLAAEYHYALALEYLSLGQQSGNERKWLPAADLCIERATFFAGAGSIRQEQGIGNYWIMRSKTLDPAGSDWEVILQRAFRHYRKAVDLQREDLRKGTVEEIKKQVWCFYPDEEFSQKLLRVLTTVSQKSR